MLHDLKKQGLSNTAIARQFGISRRTVTRRLRLGLEVPSYGPRPAKARLLEPFEGYLRDRVTAWPNLSGRRLLREVKQRGYTGGYSALTNFLREVRPPTEQPYERRFETPPGQQGQVDFAYFEVEFTDAPGVKQVVWLFTPRGAVGTPHPTWRRSATADFCGAGSARTRSSPQCCAAISTHSRRSAGFPRRSSTIA